mmetsp:Transcript_48101/g.142152  ORF Transcript_48101/g.142152 Transcript_48101/m.142152 type:complete len:217 (-) Transcript_48101:1056-1706(-)
MATSMASSASLSASKDSASSPPTSAAKATPAAASASIGVCCDPLATSEGDSAANAAAKRSTTTLSTSETRELPSRFTRSRAVTLRSATLRDDTRFDNFAGVDPALAGESARLLPASLVGVFARWRPCACCFRLASSSARISSTCEAFASALRALVATPFTFFNACFTERKSAVARKLTWMLPIAAASAFVSCSVILRASSSPSLSSIVLASSARLI